MYGVKFPPGNTVNTGSYDNQFSELEMQLTIPRVGDKDVFGLADTNVYMARCISVSSLLSITYGDSITMVDQSGQYTLGYFSIL